MEVVLLENIKNLGKIGDIVIVKDGHGRNFLIRYGKALKASKSNIELVNNEIKINNLNTLSSPVFNNGYGILQIGGFISDGKDLVSILSLEQGELKTAIFDVNQNYKLIHSKIIEVKESESILSLGVESYKTKRAEQNGLLLPFRSDNVYMLYLFYYRQYTGNTYIYRQVLINT